MPYGTPADMKKHGKGPHMESAKQERKNLMDDNPVARTAAGDRPWIAKHYKSGMNYGSPMKDKHSAMKMDSPMKKEHEESPAEFNAGLRAAAEAGKLDNNPNFKKAVMGSAAKMDAKVVKKVYKKKQ